MPSKLTKIVYIVIVSALNIILIVMFLFSGIPCRSFSLKIIVNCVNMLILRDSKIEVNSVNILIFRYPSLRVAYIDEVEEPRADRTVEKVYYSALVKAALPKTGNTAEPVQNLDQVMTCHVLK